MKSKKNFGVSAALFLATIFFYLLTLPQDLLPQSSFFQGKSITIIQGRDPGGTGDNRVKAMVPFLQKHIPGNPTIVNEFMPGGGGRKAANYLFATARLDGLTIGHVSSGILTSAVLGEAGVQYDVD